MLLLFVLVNVVINFCRLLAQVSYLKFQEFVTSLYVLQSFICNEVLMTKIYCFNEFRSTIKTFLCYLLSPVTCVTQVHVCIWKIFVTKLFPCSFCLCVYVQCVTKVNIWENKEIDKTLLWSRFTFMRIWHCKLLIFHDLNLEYDDMTCDDVNAVFFYNG